MKKFKIILLVLIIALLFGAIFLLAKRGGLSLKKEGTKTDTVTADKSGSDSDKPDRESGKSDSDSDKSTDSSASDASSQTPGSDSESQTTTEKTPVSLTISAAGDCTLGVDDRYNNRFNEKYAAKGSGYFLQNVKSVFENDDLTVVNLEGTFTTSTNRQEKTYTFKGDSSYTKILTESGVEAVTIANNHSHDFGNQGFQDTINAVSQAGLTWFGYDNIAYSTVKNEKIALIGINALPSQGKDVSYVTGLIDTAKQQNPNLIIVFFHWGIEGDAMPNSTQTEMAHASIDDGADLVLGSHPHVIQGLESYKGKYIVYSLGNFCFGGNSNPKDKDTMIFQETFNFVNGSLSESNPAKVIPCSLSGSSSTNDFQPHVLEGSEAARVIEKLNTRSSGMNLTINGDGSLQAQ